MFAMTALKASGTPLQNGYAGEFEDIAANDEYAPYAYTAYKLGLLAPRKKTPKSFSCKKIITRGEIEGTLATALGNEPPVLTKEQLKAKPTRAEIIEILWKTFGL